MSCGTNFSCTARPYSRMCACGQEGGGDAGQSGNIDVFESHAGAVGIKVLRVRKLPTLSQKTVCWCVFKRILCALISDLMIILCP